MRLKTCIGVIMKLQAEKIQLFPGESFRLLQWRDNIHDVEIVAGDGTRHPFKGSGDLWHYHSHMELTLFQEGRGTLFIGDAIMHFSAPDLVLIGANLPHYWQMRNQSSGYALQFDFDREHAFWRFPETHVIRGIFDDAEKGIHITGKMVPDIELLLQRTFTCGGLGRLAEFLKILDALSKAEPSERQTISSTTFTPVTGRATYKSLQKAIHIIFNRFQEDISFNEVLKETGMSKATFERHFRKLTGRSFTRFLSEVRLNYAGRQLIETDRTISEIAFSSGYNNLSHFNHQFKAFYQMSPRDFRRENIRDLRGD